MKPEAEQEQSYTLSKISKSIAEQEGGEPGHYRNQLQEMVSRGEIKTSLPVLPDDNALSIIFGETRIPESELKRLKVVRGYPNRLCLEGERDVLHARTERTFNETIIGLTELLKAMVGGYRPKAKLFREDGTPVCEKIRDECSMFYEETPARADRKISEAYEWKVPPEK